jgi:hypothetical protein
MAESEAMRLPPLAAVAVLLASCASSEPAVAPGLSAPVGISANRRHFIDGDGKPCFWLGDTEWQLFVAFREDEAQAILEDRRSKGFNAIQVMLLGVGGGKKPNASGQQPFLNDDVSTPNEAYFAAVDAIVRQAARLNLVLVIGVYHKGGDAGAMITAKNARSWGAWVGRRYRETPNVLWSMFPTAKESYLPVVRELAAGLAEGDGGRHPITVHPDPAPASSSWIHDEPWLAFNTLQTFKSDVLNYRMVAADYARKPVKPVLNGEARYEGEGGTTPLQVRRGAWFSVIAGGFYTYGHGGNWQKPADWRKWIDAPASRQMTVLRDTFEGLEWWSLVPDPSLLEEPAGEIVAARAADRSWAIVYFPAPGTVGLTLYGAAEWIDPSTGRTHPAGNGATFTSPEGWEDAVLIVRARK